MGEINLTRERLGACAMIVDNIQLKGWTDAIVKENYIDERKRKPGKPDTIVEGPDPVQ